MIGNNKIAEECNEPFITLFKPFITLFNKLDESEVPNLIDGTQASFFRRKRNYFYFGASLLTVYALFGCIYFSLTDTWYNVTKCFFEPKADPIAFADAIFIMLVAFIVFAIAIYQAIQHHKEMNEPEASTENNVLIELEMVSIAR